MTPENAEAVLDRERLISAKLDELVGLVHRMGFLAHVDDSDLKPRLKDVIDDAIFPAVSTAEEVLVLEARREEQALRTVPL